MCCRLRLPSYERESVPYKAFDGVIDALSSALRRLPEVDAARVLPRTSYLRPVRSLGVVEETPGVEPPSTN